MYPQMYPLLYPSGYIFCCTLPLKGYIFCYFSLKHYIFCVFISLLCIYWSRKGPGFKLYTKYYFLKLYFATYLTFIKTNSQQLSYSTFAPMLLQSPPSSKIPQRLTVRFFITQFITSTIKSLSLFLTQVSPSMNISQFCQIF